MVLAGALWAGILAGLGVALPLGAIGVLLVNEGLARGWRVGLAGALGVACVDAAYASLAVALGAAVARVLGPYEQAIRLVGSGVLLVVALLGLVRTLRARGRVLATGGADPAAGVTAGQARRAFLAFVAMTAVNPLTAVYFVALTVALGQRVTGEGAGVAFVLGVFLASAAWQAVLVGIGVLAGGRLPQGARTGLSLLGYVVVGCYGVLLARG